jgi:hypothetical protein
LKWFAGDWVVFLMAAVRLKKFKNQDGHNKDFFEWIHLDVSKRNCKVSSQDWIGKGRPCFGITNYYLAEIKQDENHSQLVMYVTTSRI